jgi:hypothetical protein
MMKTLNVGTCAALAALTLVLTAAPSAQAASARFTTTISKVLLTRGTTFGGCMAALSVNPNSNLATCGSSWVTFDCAGIFPSTDTVMAYRMLDQAQLAYALKANVSIDITDDLKSNGYCAVKRIDLLP